jgi:hypothetical protein
MRSFMEGRTNPAASDRSLACGEGSAAAARFSWISPATPNVAMPSDFAPVGSDDWSFRLSVRRDSSALIIPYPPDEAAKDSPERAVNHVPFARIVFKRSRRQHLFQIGIRFP